MRKLRLVAILAFALGAVSAGPAPAAQDNVYNVTPVVSNGYLPTAKPPDPNLVNAWGLVAGPTTPWWVSDNGADISTLYNAAGTKQGLEVHVNSAPTGVVFANIPPNFPVGPANRSAIFIWSTETGTIQGWHPTVANTAQAKVTTAGAVYKGLAIAATATGPQLYASDFTQGR